MSLTSAYPALPAFTVALVALFMKTTLTSGLQVVSRVRAGVFPIPEDARLMRKRPADAEADFVRRCANVWRNDTENLPLFLALALAYVLLGAPAQAAQVLFGAYVVLRYVHTLVFLLGLQPWRAVLYLAGMVVCWTMALKSIALLLAGT
ncbi:MAG: MAPEG family protein [Burkholderiales bacterium]|nr:MAPEG family protein [Burkholderiales bacterium]